MDILYLSHLCSRKEYERMFLKQGTVISHAAQKFHRLLTEGLVCNNCSVQALSQRVLLQKDSGELVHPDERDGEVTFSYLRCYKNPILNRIMATVQTLKRILNWRNNHPYGIVVCDVLLGEMAIASVIASKVFGIKCVAIVTDVPNPKLRAGDERKGIKAIPPMIKNSLIGLFDGYIFLTEQMNIELNRSKKPYTIIEGIVDCGVLNEPNTLEGKYQEKVCMMAGLLEDIYGVGDLISAFEKIDCPDARLFFYGKGSSVPQIIEAGKRDARICYKGELTNTAIVAEEKRATIMINPRQAIGEWTNYSFPSKNMEYMASGTPMIAYRMPCIPCEYDNHYIAVDGENGVLSLEDALKTLMKMNRETIHKMGIDAQRWIVDNKNAQRQAQKAINVLFALKKDVSDKNDEVN